MPDTLAMLIEQLQSLDAKQRSRAIFKLQPGAVNDTDAIDALVHVLCNDEDVNIVEDATWVLVRYGVLTLPALLKQVEHENPRVRHNIVHALGKIGDKQAVPALIHATGDVDQAVRLKAVYGLGQIGDPQAIGTLIASLNDPVMDVRWTASEAVQLFGDKALLHLLHALTMPSAQVRELAANLLGDLADNRSVDPLLVALETDDWQVKLAIIEALGNIGDNRALPMIKQMQDDPHPHVRAMAKAVSNRLLV